MTPKQKVLKKYPRAFSCFYRVVGTLKFRWTIFKDLYGGTHLGGNGHLTSQAAWAAAARRLKGRG